MLLHETSNVTLFALRELLRLPWGQWIEDCHRRIQLVDGQVCIPNRHPQRGIPEKPRNIEQRHTAPHQLTRVGVPQIVKAERWDSARLEQASPKFAEI